VEYFILPQQQPKRNSLTDHGWFRIDPTGPLTSSSQPGPPRSSKQPAVVGFGFGFGRVEVEAQIERSPGRLPAKGPSPTNQQGGHPFHRLPSRKEADSAHPASGAGAAIIFLGWEIPGRGFPPPSLLGKESGAFLSSPCPGLPSPVPHQRQRATPPFRLALAARLAPPTTPRSSSRQHPGAGTDGKGKPRRRGGERERGGRQPSGQRPAATAKPYAAAPPPSPLSLSHHRTASPCHFW
jgi:hypothetical protein